METHKQALEQAHEDSKNATYIIGLFDFDAP